MSPAHITKGAKRLSNDHGTGCRQHWHPTWHRRARTPQEHRDRGAWFERCDTSFVSTGTRRFSRVQSERDAFCRYCRTASGKRPESAGFWQYHERASLSRTTASPGRRDDGVASGRASGRRGDETASNSRRGAPRMAREQNSRVPRAFWIPQSASEHGRSICTVQMRNQAATVRLIVITIRQSRIDRTPSCGRTGTQLQQSVRAHLGSPPPARGLWLAVSGTQRFSGRRKTAPRAVFRATIIGTRPAVLRVVGAADRSAPSGHTRRWTV